METPGSPEQTPVAALGKLLWFAGGKPHARIRVLQRMLNMDIERVNAIGSLLADLSARTEQLRGYL